MKKSICEHLSELGPKVTEFTDLRSAYIANCVFNTFLSYTAIMLNIVTIHVIRKASSLSKTLKTLLLSLAVGLLGQPLYTSLSLVKLLQKQNFDRHTHLVFGFILKVFLIASFLGVLAISADRFLAIHLHLRYQELVTHKRVVAVAICIYACLVSPLLWCRSGSRSISAHLLVYFLALLVFFLQQWFTSEFFLPHDVTRIRCRLCKCKEDNRIAK